MLVLVANIDEVMQVAVIDLRNRDAEFAVCVFRLEVKSDYFLSEHFSLLLYTNESPGLPSVLKRVPFRLLRDTSECEVSDLTNSSTIRSTSCLI